MNLKEVITCDEPLRECSVQAQKLFHCFKPGRLKMKVGDEWEVVWGPLDGDITYRYPLPFFDISIFKDTFEENYFGLVFTQGIRYYLTDHVKTYGADMCADCVSKRNMEVDVPIGVVRYKAFYPELNLSSGYRSWLEERVIKDLKVNCLEIKI